MIPPHTDSLSPDPAPILDLIEAFRRSKTMFTAVRLGVFDQLETAPQSPEQLGALLGVNVRAFTRLLEGCLSLGLLERDSDLFRNSAVASRYLATSSPASFAGYVTYSDQSLYLLWSHLEDAVREGTNRWAQTFGSREALFDYYFRDHAATASFVSAMNGFGQLASARLARAFDLSRFHHLVDLGGATGHMAIAACEAWPNLRATVLDLPRVEPFARAHIEASSVADRVQFVVGDFFTDPLPPGDLYTLGRIVHDWGDDQVHKLLRKISATLRSGGGVILAEALVNDDRSGPVYALMQDLNMLVCTDGSERTAAEYRTLLEDAGFTGVQHRLTGSLVDGVFALKP
jgi:acetylserotonin N-methyltransferase